MKCAVSDSKDELRRQIDAVWRIAQSGLSTLREVVVRSSQAGRLRVDLALLTRERSRLLGRLGEILVGLVDKGALELSEDGRRIYEELRDVDARIVADSVQSYDNSYGAQRGVQPEVSDYEAPDAEVGEVAQGEGAH